ncbi:MAG: CoxG family protein [Candidatus Limnocylindrales bacterium]
MKINGSIEIAAATEAVWRVVVDPRDLAACVPGVSDVRQIDARTFEGTVRVAVGPIDGQFSFRSVITRMDPPGDLVVDVEGTDSMTGSRVVAHIEATLRADSADQTTVDYTATVTTKGRLAIIGDMVLRATAGVMIGQVTKCLRSRLEAGTT